MTVRELWHELRRLIEKGEASMDDEVALGGDCGELSSVKKGESYVWLDAHGETRAHYLVEHIG